MGVPRSEALSSISRHVRPRFEIQLSENRLVPSRLSLRLCIYSAACHPVTHLHAIKQPNGWQAGERSFAGTFSRLHPTVSLLSAFSPSPCFCSFTHCQPHLILFANHLLLSYIHHRRNTTLLSFTLASSLLPLPTVIHFPL